MLAVIFVPIAAYMPVAKLLSEGEEDVQPSVVAKRTLTQHERKFGETPERSSSDGSYLEVNRYLEKVLRDPQGVEIIGCTLPREVAEGWEVGCDYRAANGYGGLVKQSSVFRIAFGKVQSMRDR